MAAYLSNKRPSNTLHPYLLKHSQLLSWHFYRWEDVPCALENIQVLDLKMSQWKVQQMHCSFHSCTSFWICTNWTIPERFWRLCHRWILYRGWLCSPFPESHKFPLSIWWRRHQSSLSGSLQRRRWRAWALWLTWLTVQLVHFGGWDLWSNKPYTRKKWNNQCDYNTVRHLEPTVCDCF